MRLAAFFQATVKNSRVSGQTGAWMPILVVLLTQMLNAALQSNPVPVLSLALAS